MYQPDEFRGTSAALAYEHITRYPFGIIVSATGLGATHLPFLLDDPQSPSGLVSHFALRNDQWRTINDGEEVLVIFPGPDTYISPATYVAEEDVPTWNYTAVHVRGAYRRINDAELRELLVRTVDTFEAPRAERWHTSRMNHEDLAMLGTAVVGFSIETRTIEHGVKLSQDKTQPDIDAVTTTLSQSSDAAARAVGREMDRYAVRGRTNPPSTDPANWMH